MPELPEVETVRRLLQSRVLNKTIRDIEIFRDKNIDGDATQFKELLRGKTLQKVFRKGKVIVFGFSSSLYVTSHLRMEGKFYYFDAIEPPSKHDILRFDFTDGSALVYNDVRKFGRLALFDEESFYRSSPYAKLGPEPFDMSASELHQGLKKRNGNIKEALMDQALISGIGNIYCDETLYAVCLHPKTPAKKVSREKCEEILAASRKILNEAIQEGGSTVRSYHPGKGMDGMFQVRLCAYGKAGEPCARCGAPMKKIFVNGRGSTFCPNCQKDPNKPFILGVTGPIHSGKSSVSKYFEAKGYLHFDADKVAKEAYGDKGIKRKLIRLLGEEAYREGEPDFAYVRNYLSLHPKDIQTINAMIHPYVYKKAQRLIGKAKAKDRIVLDVPLLFPSKMDALCDVTLLVDAPLSSRISRIEKEGRDVERLIKINASYPLEQAKKKAGIVIDNDGDLPALMAKLDALPF